MKSGICFSVGFLILVLLPFNAYEAMNGSVINMVASVLAIPGALAWFAIGITELDY